jgi:hypothetical protein
MAMPVPARFDVFLSHNSREKPVVERLAGCCLSRSFLT